MPDPRFVVLEEALASYASDPNDRSIGPEAIIQAAVSVIVRGTEELDLLLIKRSHHEGDPWSGHMALPGGRREETDQSLLETAVRETFEETGVDLSLGTHLGHLDEVRPSGSGLPHLTIQPYVFGVTADTSARAASDEVDSVYWVSLDHLRDPTNLGQLEIRGPNGSRAFPSLKVEGHDVWGLTYRVLQHFLEVFPDEALREVDAP